MIGCQILLSRTAYGTFEVYLGCKYNFFSAENNEIKENFFHKFHIHPILTYARSSNDTLPSITPFVAKYSLMHSGSVAM